MKLSKLEEKREVIGAELDELRKEIKKLQEQFDNADIKPKFAEEEKIIFAKFDEILEKQEELEKIHREIENKLVAKCNQDLKS